ncbi:hypothetical protein AB0H82_08965 [Streptomyces sp. NPDC050732]|uniref:hypothetical protein n=1 Tax=Streptomyces sp. NPDC050732 TaxID=3154632 RepID=UPI0034248514
MRDSVTITGEWIEGWVSRMEGYATSFTEQFERKFGYPPDENFVARAAEPSPALDELSAAEGVPQDLVAFYQKVAEVSLPDLESGFFIHPVGHTLSGMRGDLPTRIMGSREDSVIVFGSDGGGSLYALSGTDGSTVYRLPPSRVEGGVYSEGTAPCEIMASTLADHLSAVESELESHLDPTA